MLLRTCARSARGRASPSFREPWRSGPLSMRRFAWCRPHSHPWAMPQVTRLRLRSQSPRLRARPRARGQNRMTLGDRMAGRAPGRTMAGLTTGSNKSGRSSRAQSRKLCIRSLWSRRTWRTLWRTRCCRRSPRQKVRPMSSSPKPCQLSSVRHSSSSPNPRHLSSVRPRSGKRSASIAQRRNGKSFWRRLIGTDLGRPMTWHCIPSCRRTCSARLASSSSILHLRKVAVIFATRYGARIPGASALEEVVARSTSTKGMVEGA